MLEIPIYDIKAQEIEKIELPEVVFGLKPNPSLLAQAIKIYLANQRQGTSSTKTRGEVEGSTRKIYRQKGTGRARHGSIRAPIFVKGGIAFGPKPRDFRLKMPQKMAKKALFTALSQKLQEGKIIVISNLDKISPKTKEMAKILAHFKINFAKDKPLLVLDKKIDNLVRSYRNLSHSSYNLVDYLNIFEVLNSNKIIFTKEAIQKFSPINNSAPKITKTTKISKPLKTSKTIVKKTIIKKIEARKQRAEISPKPTLNKAKAD